MILKLLFPAYRTNPNAKDFGSHFMNLLGRVFMGSPQSKGLGGVMPALRDTYYYCKHDRLIPKGKEAEDKWLKGSILLSEYRQVEHREISKATWMAVSLYAVLAVGAVGLFTGEDGSSSARSSLPSITGPAAFDGEISQQECDLLLMTGSPPMRLFEHDVDSLVAKCQADYNY